MGEIRPFRTASEPRPRGRPTANRTAWIDEFILEVALEVFLERGFQGATIEGVAERARVSKGTVYARFSGKDALFRKVMEHRIETWSCRAGQFNHLIPDDLAGRLRHHAGTLLRMLGSEELQRFTRLVEQAASDFPDLAAFWVQAGTHHFRDLIAGNLAAAAEGGVEADWTFVAELVMHGIGGWFRTETMVSEPGEAQGREYIEKLVVAVLRIIGSPVASDDHQGSPS